MLINHTVISEGLFILTIYIYYNNITFNNIYEKIKKYFTYNLPNLNDSLDPNILFNDSNDFNESEEYNNLHDFNDFNDFDISDESDDSNE